MKKVAICVLFMLIGVLFYRCSEQLSKARIEINIEEVLDNGQEVLLSEIADSIGYIQLETDSNCFVTRPDQVFFGRESIFIRQDQEILIFDDQGKFLNKISMQGKGPEEYLNISHCAYNEYNNSVNVWDSFSAKLYQYSIEGKFIGSHKISFNPKRFYFVSDSTIIWHNLRGTEKHYSGNYALTITNYYGEIQRQYLDRSEENKNDRNKVRINMLASFYMTNDSLSFWEYYYDVIYRIDLKEQKLIPIYSFNSGKYKLPYQAKMYGKGGTKEWDYHQIDNIVETSECIFIDGIFDGSKCNLIYLKKSNEIKWLLYAKKTKYGHCLANDLDGGFPFFPKGKIDDNRLFSLVYPADLEQMDNVLKNRVLRNAKDGDLEDQRKNLFSIVKPMDNPLIMIVYTK